jgi:hypothetical protein
MQYATIAYAVYDYILVYYSVYLRFYLVQRYKY